MRNDPCGKIKYALSNAPATRRPKYSTRMLFLLNRGKGPISRHTVSSLSARAKRRAGISSQHKAGHKGHLTGSLALNWAKQSKTPTGRARCLSAVRQFALFQAAFDPKTQVPPPGLFGPIFQRRRVHFYTPEELTQLLAVPFSAVGSIWFLYLLGYNMSIGVWVGLIALLGVDA